MDMLIFFLIKPTQPRPVRDEMWVEKTNHLLSHRAAGCVRLPADTAYVGICYKAQYPPLTMLRISRRSDTAYGTLWFVAHLFSTHIQSLRDKFISNI